MGNAGARRGCDKLWYAGPLEEKAVRRGVPSAARRGGKAARPRGRGAGASSASRDAVRAPIDPLWRAPAPGAGAVRGRREKLNSKGSGRAAKKFERSNRARCLRAGSAGARAPKVRGLPPRAHPHLRRPLRARRPPPPPAAPAHHRAMSHPSTPSPHAATPPSTPPTPVPPLAPLGPSDAGIADALAAWLHAVQQTPPDLPLHEAAAHAVPLCQVLHRAAPAAIAPRDFFIPAKHTGPNAARQTRYNTRRLARALLAHFAPQRPVALTPGFAARLAALADQHAAADESPTQQEIALALAEGVLCAAVHAPAKEPFINAVLTLPPHMQDALAASIGRVASSDEQSPPRERALAERALPENAAPPGLFPPSPIRSQAPLAAPAGIPPAEYKALAGERDALRRKLAGAEHTRAAAAAENESLHARLEDAGDALRALEKARDDLQKDVASKAQQLVDANVALRVARQTAEEVDMLRAQAASAEQLEASLKRASKRLEEVADMRAVSKDLEAQVSAFRENEQRMCKHTEYLETQLKSSTERAQQLAAMSDDLSSSLEDREQQIAGLKTENLDLKEKLSTANTQLTSMLVHSSHTGHGDEGTTATQSERSSDDGSGDDEQPDPAIATVAVTENGDRPQFSESVVTDHLFNEIGVRMSWDDIVECIRGVMDALREMEEGEENSQEYPISEDTGPSHDVVVNEVPSCDSTRGTRSEDADNIETRKSVLPAFAELDSRLEAASKGKGDEFDFAANECNVQEIPVVHQRSIATKNANSPHSTAAVGSNDSSYTSGYTSDGVSDGVDETVNVVEEPTAALHVESSSIARRGSLNKDNDVAAMQANGESPEPSIAAKRRSGSKLGHAVLLSATKLASSEGDHDSIPANVRKAASLTVSVLRGIPRSPSYSARALVRQARSELSALQEAMEAMRVERQNSVSIGVLVQQLQDLQEELRIARELTSKRETENNELRREVNVLLKEFDALSVEKTAVEKREDGLVQEKERLVKHLQDSLDSKDEEIKELKEDVSRTRQHVEVLRDAEVTMKEKLHAAEVVSKAQEVELARLSAKVEANEMMTTRLNAVVHSTDGLKTEMNRQRESHKQDIAEAARREKELAQEARDEAKRVAKSHAKVLEDVRATAVAAAMARSRQPEDRGLQSRKSTRFADFWRKLLHIEKVPIDYSVPPSTGTVPPARRSASRTPSRSA